MDIISFGVLNIGGMIYTGIFINCFRNQFDKFQESKIEDWGITPVNKEETEMLLKK